MIGNRFQLRALKTFIGSSALFMLLLSSSGCLLFAQVAPEDAGSSPEPTAEVEPDEDGGVEPEDAGGEPDAEPSDGGVEPDVGPADGGGEPDADGGGEPDADGGGEPEDAGFDAGPPDTTLPNATVNAPTPVIRGDTVELEIAYAGPDNVAAVTVDPGSGWAVSSTPIFDGSSIQVSVDLVDDRLAQVGAFSGAVFFVLTVDFDSAASGTSLVEVDVIRGEGPHVKSDSVVAAGLSCGHPALPCPNIARAIANMNVILGGSPPPYPREIRLHVESEFDEPETLVFGDLALRGGFIADAEARNDWIFVPGADRIIVNVVNAKVTFGTTADATRAMTQVDLAGAWTGQVDNAFVAVNGPLFLDDSVIRLDATIEMISSHLHVVDVASSVAFEVAAGSAVNGPATSAILPADTHVATVATSGNVKILGNIQGVQRILDSSEPSFAAGLWVRDGVASVEENALVNGGNAPEVYGVLVEGGTFSTPTGSLIAPVIVGGENEGGAARSAIGVSVRKGGAITGLGGLVVGGESTEMSVGLRMEDVADSASLPIEIQATIRNVGTSSPVTPGIGAGVFIVRANDESGSTLIRFVDSDIDGVGSSNVSAVSVIDNRSAGHSTELVFSGTHLEAATPNSQNAAADRVVALYLRGRAVEVDSENSGTVLRAVAPQGSGISGVDTTSPVSLGVQIDVEERDGETPSPTNEVVGLRCASPAVPVTVALRDAPMASPELQSDAVTGHAMGISVLPGCTLDLEGANDGARYEAIMRSDQGRATGLRLLGRTTVEFAEFNITNIGAGPNDIAVGVDAFCPDGLSVFRSSAINTSDNAATGDKTIYGVRLQPRFGSSICEAERFELISTNVTVDDLAGGLTRGLFVRDMDGLELRVADSVFDLGISDGAMAMDVMFGLDSDILIERNLVKVARAAAGGATTDNAGIRVTGSVVPDKVQIRNNFVDMLATGGGSTRRSAGIAVDDRTLDAFSDLNAEILIAHNTVRVDGWPQSVGLAATAEFSEAVATNHLSGRTLANWILFANGAIGVEEVCVMVNSDRYAGRFSSLIDARNAFFGADADRIRSFDSSGTAICDPETALANTLFANSEASTNPFVGLEEDGCPESSDLPVVEDKVLGGVVWAQGESPTFGNWVDGYDDVTGAIRNSQSDIGNCEIP